MDGYTRDLRYHGPRLLLKLDCQHPPAMCLSQWGVVRDVALSSHSSILPSPIDEPNSDNCASKPEDSTQETKRFASFPAVAYTAVRDAVPVKDTVTTVVMADGIDKKTESSEPGGRQEEVHWPVYEATSEGE